VSRTSTRGGGHGLVLTPSWMGAHPYDGGQKLRTQPEARRPGRIL